MSIIDMDRRFDAGRSMWIGDSIGRRTSGSAEDAAGLDDGYGRLDRRCDRSDRRAGTSSHESTEDRMRMGAMMRTGGRRILAASFVVLGGAAMMPSAAAAQRTLDPALAEATFDSAWSIINRTFWDTTFNGVNWAAARDELRPRARAAGTDAELREIIQGMLDRLRVSHLSLIPGDAADELATASARPEGPPGDAGMELRWVDGSAVVTRVLPGSAAEAAGIRAGWIVEGAGAITDARIRDALQRVPGASDPRRYAAYAAQAMASGLQGSEGDTVRLRVKDGADAAREVAVVLRTPAGQFATLGNLPPVLANVEAQRVTRGGAEIGVIRFPIWLPAIIQQFDRAVDDMRGADGIVIDLRGNPGGLGGMAPGFAGHFVDRRDTLGTMLTRRDVMHMVINPRRVSPDARPVVPYAGPVAVLVDEGTASTSEFFAGGMQALGRARVFGSPSSGQALPSLMPRLPNGDVLLHAIADFVGPDGERWEGRGVIPDVAAPPTRAALLAGEDPALDAALAWIAGEARGR
jgi:carboxyl-terminal processing protease